MALLQPKEIAQPQNQLTLQGVASLARHAELAIHSAEVGVSDFMVGPQLGGAPIALWGAPASEPFAALQNQIKRWQQARARRRPRSPGGSRRLRRPWCKPGLPIARRGGRSLRR